MIAAAAPGAAARAKPAGGESSTSVRSAVGGGGGATAVPSPRSASILATLVGLASLVPLQLSASKGASVPVATKT